MPAVSNSSPLIILGAMGRIEILRDVYGEVSVAPAVWRETVEDGAGRPGSTETERATWIHRRLPDPGNLSLAALAGLDAGEAESIALALSLPGERTIILDDRVARRVAQQLSLTLTGTAGVIVRAKTLGVVAAVRPLLVEARSAGLHLNDAAFERFLQLAGEH